MKRLNYEIVSQTRYRFLKRSQTKTLKIRIRNTGTANWHSVAVKDAESHLIVRLDGEEPHLDFKSRPGRLSDKSDRKFAKVRKNAPTNNKRANQTVAPGEVAELFLQIIPKKYSTQGWHQVRIVPDIRQVGRVDTKNTGDDIFSRVYIKKDGFFWFHLRRRLKLTFSKPGEVASIYENRAYKKATPSEQSSHMPVVMATWQRVENLRGTIRALRNQKNSKPVLYLWNNNPDIANKVERLASRTKLPVKVYHSRYNIGGYGRFYLAKDISKYYVKILFVDDDQLLATNTVSGFAREFEPQTLKGYWAYKFNDPANYWRKSVVAADQHADYIGTGGMLADAQIFNNQKVFECPKKYWFIEDVWISYIASHHLKWKTLKTKTTLQINDDGKDQLNKLIDLKTEMLKKLLRKGWKIKF